MALIKVTYVDGTTVIHSSNLNAIQDEIIANAASIATNTSNISTNTANISELSGDVEDITGDITELSEAVADNTEDIATNTAAIATNTEDIEANTEAIATKADQDTTYTKTEVDDLVDAVETELQLRGGFFIHDAVIQSGSTMQIECYNADGTPMADNTRVNFRLNGTNYPLNVSGGKVSMQVSLEANKDYSYIIYLNNSKTHKSGIINVW